jgi:hypothetical protein
MNLGFIIFILIAILVIYWNYTQSQQEKQGIKSCDDLIQQGNKSFQTRNFKQALENYKSAIVARPSNYGNYHPEYQIVKCLYYLGEYNEVIKYTRFENEEEKLFYISSVYIKLNNKKSAKSFIDRGIKINALRFNKLRDQIINPITDLEFFWQSLERNSKILLLKNIESTSNIISIKPLDFELLMNIEYLDLSCRSESVYFGRTVVADSYKYIEDVSFLKYFTNLKYLNICGQKNISEISAIENCKLIEEINLAYTSVKDASVLIKNKNLKYLNFYSTPVDEKTVGLIKIANPICKVNSKFSNIYENNSTLQSLIKPTSFDIHTKYFNDLRDYFEKLENNNKLSQYPKVLLPMDFDRNPEKFKDSKIIKPVYNRVAIQTIGTSEKYFYSFLKRNFGNQIFDHAALEKHKNYLPKFPDFLLVDEKNRIYIDIEIDEPYAFNIDQVSHCIGDDDERNFEFLYNNWFVIRFTEEQVVRFPEECCDFIDKIKIQILQKLDGKKIEFNYSFPFKQNPWTIESALKLKAINYRNNYLQRI